MGQLQKKFEQHEQAQFSEVPEGSIPWTGSDLTSSLPKDRGAPRPTVPGIQIKIRALQLGALLIVVLLLVLLFG